MGAKSETHLRALLTWTYGESVYRVPRRESLIILLLLLLAVVTHFWGLGEGSLYDWDEALHAQIAQEMVWRGDLLTPYLGGEPHLTKPPLYYWQTILAYHVFGTNEFAARFPAALAGVGVVLMTYLLGRDLLGRTVGLGAALLLLIVDNLPSARLYNLVSMDRMAMMTAPLAFYGLLTVWLGWKGERDRRYIIALGLPLGLAVMTKNIAGLLPLIGVLLYWLLSRPLRRWPWRELALALGLLAAIALPWHLAVTVRHGRFFWWHYLYSNVLRRATVTIDNPDQAQGLRFYLDIVRQGFPYMVYVLPLSVLQSGYRAARYRERAPLLLLAWASVPWVVYSLAKTKHPWYIMESYPPLALLISSCLAGVLGQRWALALIVGSMIAFGWRVPVPRQGPRNVKDVATTLRYLADDEEAVALCRVSSDYPRPATLFYAGRPVTTIPFHDDGADNLMGARYLLTDLDTWEMGRWKGQIVRRAGEQLLVRLEQ